MNASDACAIAKAAESPSVGKMCVMASSDQSASLTDLLPSIKDFRMHWAIHGPL